MVEFNEIKIEDKDIFNKYFNIAKPKASELTFANLFIWREDYGFSYSIINDMLCLISDADDYPPFAFCPLPLKPPTKEMFNDTINRLEEYFKYKGWNLFFARIEEDFLPYFTELLDREIMLEPLRDIADYIYLTDSLLALKGKNLMSKRNHINKLLRTYYEVEYVPYENKYYDDCVRILNDWCKRNNCQCENPIHCEKYLYSQFLKDFDKFDCKCALIKVDGKFEAFTLGEIKNNDTAVIHIEKANTEIQGIYPYINQKFIENEWSKTIYINREEDMGIEGLRKAKMSYQPFKLLMKYIIRFK